MDYFKPLTFKKAQQLVQKRQGEIKFFEDVAFATSKTSIEEQLKKSSAEFVLFGIAEDIGVQANGGKTGAKNAWDTVLKTLLNIQSNHFTKPSHLLVLGHFDFDKLDQKISEKKTSKSFEKRLIPLMQK